MLDGEITEATASIEGIGSEGARGARLYAAVALAAVAREGCVVGIDVVQDEEFAQEEGAACMGNDELLVAPYPAQPATPCPVAFGNGCGVDKASACSTNGGEQLLQALAHDVVIVEALGVHADACGSLGREVVECHTDDGAHARNEQSRVEAHGLVARHVVHRAMMASGNPLAKALGVPFLDGQGWRNAASRKAET